MSQQFTDSGRGDTIGRGPNSPVSFHGASPTGQRSGAAQAPVTQTQTGLTDNSGGAVSQVLAALTGLATSGGNTYSDAAVNAKLTIIANAIASLAAELALAKADVAAAMALVNELQAAMVAKGLIKGAA